MLTSSHHVACVVLSIVLAACGHVESTNLRVSQDEKFVFEFDDHRPPQERETQKETNPHWYLTKLGDESISPPGPKLLRAKLHEKGSPALQRSRIVLEEFSVQVFEPRDTTHQWVNAGASAGPVGMLFGGLIGAAATSKSVSVKIVGTANGKEFNAGSHAALKGRVFESDLNRVITEALDDAVAKITKLLNMDETR